MSLFQRWQSFLEGLRAQDRYRRLRAPSGIDFSSNDYLGYGKLPGPDPAAFAHLSGSGQASRLLRGAHELWEQVEEGLARWHGAESALVMNSGYSANEGLLSAIIEPGDFLASDQLNHASIIDGARLAKGERFIFRHNDLGQLEDGLQRAASSGERFIITESLFGMEGDRAPLSEHADLAEKYGAHLIVDEAHATGCFAATGGGLVDELGLRDRVVATVHTGGKALGVCGAYICCSKMLRDVLINRCRHFIFTTALPPVLAPYWLAMLERVEGDHERRQALHRGAELFRRELAGHGLPALGNDYIVPVVLSDDGVAVKAAAKLQAAGFDIRAIRPPTVAPGTARLRISIHADHSPDELERLALAVFSAINQCHHSN